MSKISWGKWSKYKILTESKEMLPHLPETCRMTRIGFWDFVNRFKEVIVKPSKSCGGKGIYQVSALDPDRFAVRNGKRTWIRTDRHKLYGWLRSRTGSNYIVQRKIELAAINGRPMDIRVMVRRQPSGDFSVTGKLAKVAGAGFIVTNIRRSKGMVMVLEDALAQSNLSVPDIPDLVKEIDKVSLAAAQLLHPHYPRFSTIGMDIGVDDQGAIWIIEANLAPSRGLFRKLEKVKAGLRRARRPIRQVFKTQGSKKRVAVQGKAQARVQDQGAVAQEQQVQGRPEAHERQAEAQAQSQGLAQAQARAQSQAMAQTQEQQAKVSVLPLS